MMKNVILSSTQNSLSGQGMMNTDRGAKAPFLLSKYNNYLFSR